MFYLANVSSRSFLRTALCTSTGLLIGLGLSSCNVAVHETPISSPAESAFPVSTNATSSTSKLLAESSPDVTLLAESSTAKAAPSESTLVASDSSSSSITYDYLAPEKQLTATVNGETFVLIDLMTPSPSNLFLDVELRQGNPAAEFLSPYELGIASIEQVGDFDGDGFEDALVGFSSGGNCCAPGYAMISVLDDGSFRLSPLLDWAWNPPQPTTYNGQPAFETRTENQVYIHAYENGKVVLLDERIIQERQAIAQLLSSEVIAGEAAPQLAVDINDDGTMETLNCEVWDRWQSLLCQLNNADGTLIQDFSMGCDRYGILPTLSNGMHDIVCDEQAIARWDGTEYVWD